jgi:hypothetical protein
LTDIVNLLRLKRATWMLVERWLLLVEAGLRYPGLIAIDKSGGLAGLAES